MQYSLWGNNNRIEKKKNSFAEYCLKCHQEKYVLKIWNKEGELILSLYVMGKKDFLT